MKTILSGFVAGILLTLIVWGFLKEDKVGTQPAVVASVTGSQLSYADLRKLSSSDLVPVENDEYEILRARTEEWIQDALIKKEMQAENMDKETLFKKKIWANVNVSYEDLRTYYDQNRELFTETFEQVSGSISQELRRKAYVQAKKEYLEALRTKYEAKTYLRKPGSFVEGLAVKGNSGEVKPAGEPALKMAPTAPVAAAQPAAAPAPVPSAAPQPAAAAGDLALRPVKGNPSAAVTLIQYSDFHCPFCQRLEPTLDEVLKNYGDKVRIIWRHFPLPFHTGAERTHEATECAFQQGKFWEFHKELFANMGADKSDTGLKAMAAKLGLDAGKFDQCLAGSSAKDWVKKDLAAGQAAGVQGTPAVFVNGQLISGAVPYDQFKQAIDGALSGKPAVVPSPALAPAAPAAPSEVTFNDLAGRPFKGPENAKVTLVEFSDFHCSFCSRHAPNLDKIVQNFPNQVKLVWRHYPLSMHQGAERTHQASECAHEQGKFWVYHDALFADPSADKSDSGLKAMAAKVGLDMTRFDQCLTSGRTADIVRRDLAAGTAAKMQGTPATYVNGRLVSGAQPYEKFAAMVDSLIKTGQFPPEAAPTPAPAPAPVGPVTFDDLAGRPFKGPADAPVTLVQFSDYHCPFCQRVEPTIKQIMDANPGKVKVVWRHNPLPFHTGADKTHTAAECAFQQGKFWEYHDDLFSDMQADRSEAGLLARAEKLGLDKAKYQACMTSGQAKAMVDKDLAAGAKAGVRGTPATFVNGALVSGAQPIESFSRLIDSVIKTGKLPEDALKPPAPPAPVGPVTFDDLAGRPFKGPADAPVTLVQFSDYHCPFCQRVEPTIKQIMDANPGKVKVVWRHNPLPFHTGADKTHTAAECAFQQGKFWEYHDDLFSDMQADRSEAGLLARAEKLGLDKAKYQACMTSGQAKAMVDKDLAAGAKAGVRGTPATFINGILVSGAQPFESFNQTVQTELSKKR
ncbi:MAG: thioredoxin domain-containing protein [Candidatus Omnitrophica bacterium]|nr:thioredoxin domain-containing protein [Candidatus Omnitrophota bacterium]